MHYHIASICTLRRREFLLGVLAAAGGCRRRDPSDSARQVPPTTPNTKKDVSREDLASDFEVSLYFDYDSLLPAEPLLFRCNITNTSSEAHAFPFRLGPNQWYLIDPDEHLRNRFLWNVGAMGKNVWPEEGTLAEAIVGPGETWCFDHVCYERRGPAGVTEHVEVPPALAEPGSYSLQVADYEGRINGWDRPPVYRSPKYTVMVRKATAAEQGLGRLLMDARSRWRSGGGNKRDERLSLIENLRSFATQDSHIPGIDHVRLVLSRLLIQAASPPTPDEDYDYHLLAESFAHAANISPQRSILYREAITPGYLQFLTRWKIHDHVDVAGFVENIRRNPPYTKSPQFAGRQQQLNRKLEEIEQSLKERQQRRPPPSKKLA